MKKQWGNLLLILLLLVLLVPQARMPVQVIVQRAVALSPPQIDAEKRKTVENLTWELMGPNGAATNISASRGKVVLINQWATWCPPCIAEMPSLQRLYDDFKDGTAFYFITSEDAQTVNRFVTAEGYTLPFYISTQKPPEGLQGGQLPTTWVLSKKGEVVVQKIGAAKWDSAKMKMVLAQLIAE